MNNKNAPGGVASPNQKFKTSNNINIENQSNSRKDHTSENEPSMEYDNK